MRATLGVHLAVFGYDDVSLYDLLPDKQGVSSLATDAQATRQTL